MSRSSKKMPFVAPELKKMIEHKLGEFAPTRTFKGHAGSKEAATSKAKK